MLRKFTANIASFIFSSMLILFFITLTLLTILRPANIKEWMASSGLYKDLPSIVLDNAGTGSSNNAVSVTNPLIQSAAKAVLTSSLVQSISEKIIDGSFQWLDKEVPQPDFTIDLAPTKTAFADRATTLIRERYESLPSCGRRLPASTDPLTIDCRPLVSFDINTQLANLRTQIETNKDFLPDTILNAQTLKINSNGSQQPVFEQYQQLPDRYELLKKVPVLSSVIAILMAIAIIFCSKTKLRGVRKIGVTLVISGVFAGIGLWASGVLVNNIQTQISQPSQSQDYSAYIISITNAARSDFVATGTKIAGTYVLIGLVLAASTYIYERRLKPTTSQTTEVPTT